MKIKNSLLIKLANLTSKEMDFFLYIARFQDDYGFIEGVYYRDVMKHCQMCKQSFYKALRALQDKDVITYTRGESQDYNIRILDNKTVSDADRKEGYINLNRNIFHNKHFKKLKAHEKYLLLDFMRITCSSGYQYRTGTNELYEKYKEILQVTKRVIRDYLHTLKKFFEISIRGKNYIISKIHRFFEKKQQEKEITQHYDYFVRTQCRKNRIKSSVDKICETVTVIKQYRPKAQKRGRDILRLAAMCIEQSVEGISGKKSLSPAYLNKLLSGILNTSYLPN